LVECGFLNVSMPALPPDSDRGADMLACLKCAKNSSFDHLIGERLQCGWHSQAELLCGLEVDDKFVC
ncbi:MAG: hypothetical protein QOJ15_7082, partial [Bradyrhizobium sp.]|nr:hypothetical protein [Bradyrhizobium sp.]